MKAKTGRKKEKKKQKMENFKSLPPHNQSLDNVSLLPVLAPDANVNYVLFVYAPNEPNRRV